MDLDRRPFMIIQAGALQASVVQGKAQRTDQVQVCPGVGA